MSRIESALEKAAQLRGTEVKPVPAAKKLQAPSPLPMPSFEINLENPLLVTANAPDTPIAEEYRKLKSVVVKLTRSEKFHNTLMITSALGSEGKSITALNLAITMAQEYDHTVLIVDADLRKPSLHSYLGIEAGQGLTECLLGEMELGAAISRTAVNKLSLLQAGRKIGNPAEIFSSYRLNELLVELKQRYPDRYVIIDTPPVLPFAETRSLSALVDGILFVVKEGIASVSEIAESLDTLKRSAILGIVYNEASVDSNAGRYLYY